MADKYRISSFRILKIECNMLALSDIALKEKKESATLKVQEKIIARKALNSSGRIIRLEIETLITSDDLENMKIELLSHAIFQFPESTEDVESILQNEGCSIVQSKIYDAIKSITEVMGIPPIDLNVQDKKHKTKESG